MSNTWILIMLLYTGGNEHRILQQDFYGENVCQEALVKLQKEFVGSERPNGVCVHK